MDIVIGGSYHKFLKQINDYHELFEKNGHHVLAPMRDAQKTKINKKWNYVLFQGQENADPLEVQRDFVNEFIFKADAFVIVNPNGYIGLTATTEFGAALMGITVGQKDRPDINLKHIYFTNRFPLMSQIKANWDLSPEEAKKDPEYQYLINHYADFSKRWRYKRLY